jgi:hypothetical protein
MNKFLFLVISLLAFNKVTAQNSRWMFLSTNAGVALSVDTLKDDIKQVNTDDGHNNVTTLWVKTVQNRKNKKGSYIESAIVHFVLDTVSNQIGTQSISVYHNSTSIQSQNFLYLNWQDVIPESGGEVLIKYCKALNNSALMEKFISNAKSQPKLIVNSK